MDRFIMTLGIRLPLDEYDHSQVFSTFCFLPVIRAKLE
jgi:hypothetical protein